MIKEQYKLGEVWYSTEHGRNMRNILKRTKILGIIPVWSVYESVYERPGVEEIVYLNNNPDVMEQRIKDSIKKLQEQGLLQ